MWSTPLGPRAPCSPESESWWQLQSWDRRRRDGRRNVRWAGDWPYCWTAAVAPARPEHRRVARPPGRAPVGRRRDRPPHGRASFRMRLQRPVHRPLERERNPLHKRRTGLGRSTALAAAPWEHLGFWAWSQHPLDGAGMQTHPKAGPDAFGQLAKTGRRLTWTIASSRLRVPPQRDGQRLHYHRAAGGLARC